MRIIFLLLFVLFVRTGFAIPYIFSEKLDWNSIQKVAVDEQFSFDRLAFEGAVYNRFESFPRFVKTYPIHSDQVKLEANITNLVFQNVSEIEKSVLLKNEFKHKNFDVKAELVLNRKEPFARVEVIPVRWNNDLQQYEKLISFDIVIEITDTYSLSYKASAPANNSVLSNGDWFKVRVSKSGIFKITYSELEAMGFNVSSNPKNIALYGNGGGTLPEKNNSFRYDDLVENPIVVVGEEDGTFNSGDYILFYGEGPVTWRFNYLSNKFDHQTNFYDDYSYYFITSSGKSGKRIGNANEPDDAADIELNSFNDYAFHESDERNLGGTGRLWYGELFDFNSTREFDFNFPNLIKTEDGFIQADFASIAESANIFEIYVNETKEKTLTMPTISPTNAYQLAAPRSTAFTFLPNNDFLTVKLIYKRSSSSSSGYLNYLSLNVERQLKMAGEQMIFRKAITDENISVIGYNLTNPTADLTIWDVSEAVNPRKVNANYNSGKFRFKAMNDSLREFVAFTGNEYFNVEFVEKVENQNLHSVRNIDYLIIAHPDFMEQAQELAEFHRNHSGLITYIAEPGKIYNEFSSGSQDVSAIRDFAKMLYDYSSPGKELKYMLLFGDASYDYKDILPDNTNFVPCWETEKPANDALNIIHSIATDDYFGYLDDGEGSPGSSSDKVDIGIGRFVVGSVAEAEMAVNKSIHYASNSADVMGPWRNILTFVTDDGDGNRHLKDGEHLSEFMTNTYPVYNLDKIYLDAYKQISTPSGQRAPDVNEAINNRISKGTLVMNYNGHGGEVGWTEERILQTSDINSWSNYDMMPIFITATCEFSRYDDPTRVSAGELVFLNSKGGGIALFTTARATYASTNLILNLAIYTDNLFTKVNGEYPRFGDVIRKSKVLGGDNDKKFVLLGDPALQLAYPDYIAETIKINGNLVVDSEADTLKALSQIRIEGSVTDEDGNKMSTYDGLIYPTVFDKYTEVVTLGDENPTTKFDLRQSVLFNGKASIKGGEFKVEFVVPKDIAYKFGNGRISYYLQNDTDDGHGYYENIKIGGYDETANEDNEGPLIDLFMNDSTFQSGGITDQNPSLLAKVFDESGINTTGNGIGHDISAWIDNDDNKSYTLNQYYEADVDSYNSGRITYPFRDLPDGEHTLNLKVWDIYNNSSTAQINFLVVSNHNIIVEQLRNYPNPFITNTEFVFRHNQSGQDLDVLLEIYTSSGQLIKSIETVMQPEGYVSDPIYWDGSTDAGGKIGRGLYIYRVVVQNEFGAQAVDQSKLIYVR